MCILNCKYRLDQNLIYQILCLKSRLNLARIRAERPTVNPKDDKILNVEELSKFFGVSNQTIWRWCKHGKLPAFKIGSQWKIRQSDINKIINQKVNKNSSDVQIASLF
jgi:excisionase family DNA binding protein